MALDVDAFGNLVDSCPPGDACFPFLDSFYDDNNLDGSSGRIYADWIEVPFNGSPKREIFAIYPDVFGVGQRLQARVMEAGENPEQIALPINTTIDVEAIGGQWILARRNVADTLDIHHFPAGVQSDGDSGSPAELGVPVTIDSPFCGAETDRDNDAIRVDDDLAGRGLAAVAHFTCDEPAATETAVGSLVVQLIETVDCAQDPTGVPDCDLGSLAVGASVDIDFVFGVDPDATGTRSLDATVGSDLPDPDATNDSATAGAAFDDDVLFSNGFE